MRNFSFTFVIAAVLLTAPFGSVSADMISGVSLGAQSIVDSVNGMSYGKGFAFNTEQPYFNAVCVKAVSHWDTGWANLYPGVPDLSAYANTGANHNSFITVDVGNQLTTGINGLHFGTLNYSNGTTSTAYEPHNFSLSVGAAYLYQLLASSNSVEDINDLSLAIRWDRNRFGWGITEDEIAGFWNSNMYMRELLSINSDRSFWESVYDPDAYYDEIGNYSIFVMNVADNGNGPHDILYIAGAANPYDGNGGGTGDGNGGGTGGGDPGTPAATPEPATMLMFGMGLCTLPFARRLRRK